MFDTRYKEYLQHSPMICHILVTVVQIMTDSFIGCEKTKYPRKTNEHDGHLMFL